MILGRISFYPGVKFLKIFLPTALSIVIIFMTNISNFTYVGGMDPQCGDRKRLKTLGYGQISPPATTITMLRHQSVPIWLHSTTR